MFSGHQLDDVFEAKFCRFHGEVSGKIWTGNHCWLVVWLPFSIFPEILGMSSFQLTKSYFSEGWPWPTNQHWLSHKTLGVSCTFFPYTNPLMVGDVHDVHCYSPQSVIIFPASQLTSTLSVHLQKGAYANFVVTNTVCVCVYIYIYKYNVNIYNLSLYFLCIHICIYTYIHIYI